MNGISLAETAVAIDDMSEVMGVLNDNFEDGDCGLFFCRNWAGDPMENIYDDGSVSVDICRYYSYFEVFGLTKEQQMKLEKYYNCLRLASGRDKYPF